MLYLDTSALVKLCRIEVETKALIDWLAKAPGDWVTSGLSEVELTRAISLADPAALTHVPGVLAQCDRLELDRQVRADAAALRPPALRTLDALHLATALELAPDLEAFVTYDERLAAAVRGNGLAVVAPS
ncbi:type II toxin-antitoxin system VapC family toxin [Jiangella gansuensis]|uniref:type II toxin-antitoxin system VapC family toxin n=1 Tax=Jiangella gansuensis TaxID=281473 RepID=UPI00047A7BAF|nr:type II toxin-antitoxin system VapC family toxin [Jiangella gansuensis]